MIILNPYLGFIMEKICKLCRTRTRKSCDTEQTQHPRLRPVYGAFKRQTLAKALSEMGATGTCGPLVPATSLRISPYLIGLDSKQRLNLAAQTART